MADRRFVYDIHSTEARTRKLDSIESVLEEYASDGWRLAETLEHGGTTIGLVFERPVDEG